MENVAKNEANTALASREVGDYLNDSKVTNELLMWAEALNVKFRGNSFTLEQVVKKTPMRNAEESGALMALLCFKGYAIKNEDSSYKVKIGAELKISLLERSLQVLDEQREKIKAEIEAVKSNWQSSLSQ